MKRLALILALILSTTTLAVSDLNAAINTTKTLIAAINADASRPGFEEMQYLPGYGLVTVAEQYGAFGGATDKTMTITKSLATALAPTLRGLEAGDWLNFNVRYGSSSEYTHVTLRAKYGDLTANSATAWELWVNGKKQ